MCNVTVPVLSSNMQSSLTWEAVCVAFIITCFGSLSPKDNVPETLIFWFVVIVESCLMVTSVAGSCWAVGSGLGGTLHSKETSEFEHGYAVDCWLNSQSPSFSFTMIFFRRTGVFDCS